MSNLSRNAEWLLLRESWGGERDRFRMWGSLLAGLLNVAVCLFALSIGASALPLLFYLLPLFVGLSCFIKAALLALPEGERRAVLGLRALLTLVYLALGPFAILAVYDVAIARGDAWLPALIALAWVLGFCINYAVNRRRDRRSRPATD